MIKDIIPKAVVYHSNNSQICDYGWIVSTIPATFINMIGWLANLSSDAALHGLKEYSSDEIIIVGVMDRKIQGLSDRQNDLQTSD